MKSSHTLLLGILFLAACTTVHAPSQETAPVSSSAASSGSVESIPSFDVSTSSSSAAIPFEQALDKTFTSEKLGISFRYPSSFTDLNCGLKISVTAREVSYGVELVQDPLVGPDMTGECHPLNAEQAKAIGLNPVVGTLYAQRAVNDADLRKFIDQVFPYECQISEQSKEKDLTMIFLASKVQYSDEPDFACGEAIQWHRPPGVAFYSPLGSKTGGGFHFQGKETVLMPDGSVEQAFDWAIMSSVTFN